MLELYSLAISCAQSLFKSTLYVGEHYFIDYNYLVSTLYCFAIAICVALNV